MIKKIKFWIYRFMEKIINHSRFIYFVTDIGTAQRLIAFNDTQNFIYKKSSLNTLSFTSADAKKELRTYCIENIPNSGNVFEFGVYKGNSISFFANFLGGFTGSYIDTISESYGLSGFFMIFALIPILAGIVMFILNKFLIKKMHGYN